MLVFDFDGVLTDDLVLAHQDGSESVSCSRADSLGISQLKKYVDTHDLNLKIMVVSTETNPVVESRCKKLQIDCFPGVHNKGYFLKNYTSDHGLLLSKTLFVGNDLNDLEAIKLSRYSFAPANADPRIKEIVTKVFKSLGGKGFVREVIEYLVPELWDS